MSDNLISVGLGIRSHKVRDGISDAVSSVPGFHVRDSADHGGCDILILEVGEDFRNDCEAASKLLSEGTVKDIFLVSSCVESEVLLQAMRVGAREFFPLPVKKEELVSALLKFRERIRHLEPGAQKKKKGRIINVVGSKGGIGTTTIAVNLAASLHDIHNSRASVALMDMNLLFGEIPLFLDMEPEFNWGEVVSNIARLDSTYLMSILSRHSSGILVLPSPTRLEGGEATSPGVIERLLRFMQTEFDYIVIDSGQSLNGMSLKVIELSDTILINAILSLPCLINVKRLRELFRRLGYPADDSVRIVINRYHKNSVISIKDAEQGIEKRIFWEIPNDFHTTVSAINQGKTLSAVSHKAEITRNIRELAANFAAKAEKQQVKKPFPGWQFIEVKT
jgi:pilus assembly protein CpaE